MNKFYITTSIAYTNSLPHVGYALELIQADVLARYNKLLGKEVFFLTGTDEHGRKNAEAAEKLGKDPQQFVDEIASQFQKLTGIFNISNDDFIRTTDQKRHWPTAQKVWNKIVEAGDLYKAKYKGLYCVGHEAFVKPGELESGKCPLHDQEPQVIEEENWFFRLSKYKNDVKNLLTRGDLKILPENKTKEVLAMLEDLEDISFSRPSKDLSWGVPVPNDPDSTFYVWVEALINYLSGVEYAVESEKYKKFWPADGHLIGKDIVKFHAIYWPAILSSAGLPLPKAIYIHGFITVEGQKMSKTIGNVVDPFKLVKKYGVDPVRYYLLREIPSNEDGDFSIKKLEDRYNGDLANNLGNLVSRVAKLIQTKSDNKLIFEQKFLEKDVEDKINETKKNYVKAIEEFRLHEALGKLWELLTFANVYIDQKKPWTETDPASLQKTLTGALTIIIYSASLLKPFLPETAEKIYQGFGADFDVKDWEGYHFKLILSEPLFPRL